MRQRRGVIILELLMATALIGVTVIAIYLALIYGRTSLIRANHQTVASQFASQELERLRSLTYDQITVPYNGPLLSGVTIADQLPEGSGSLTINEVANVNSLKEAVVTITWTERGQSRTVSQTSLFSANGLNNE